MTSEEASAKKAMKIAKNAENLRIFREKLAAGELTNSTPRKHEHYLGTGELIREAKRKRWGNEFSK